MTFSDTERSALRSAIEAIEEAAAQTHKDSIVGALLVSRARRWRELLDEEEVAA